jgi:hypothetical protein
MPPIPAVFIVAEGHPAYTATSSNAFTTFYVACRPLRVMIYRHERPLIRPHPVGALP